jgi:cytochrome b6-f complex iron-sulfur subunit
MTPPERRPLPVLTTRRAFIGAAARTVAAGAVAGAAAPLLASCRASAGRPTSAPQPAVAANAAGHSATVDVRPLTADGAWLVTPWPGPDGAPVLIVRQSRTTYLALSMQCTHLGCPVNVPVQGVLTCPCHGSQYDLGGEVRRGPAQYPLGRYTTAYDAGAGKLTVALS